MLSKEQLSCKVKQEIHLILNILRSGKQDDVQIWACPSKSAYALPCSEMLVQWTTRDKGSPKAFWRTKDDKRMSTAPASSDTYRREDLCGGVANSTGYINPGWFHTAKLTGLQPSTEYQYSFGDEVHSLSCLNNASSSSMVGKPCICFC